MYKREEDPFDKLMELSLYDAQNPIQDWMEHGRSNKAPLLDKKDTQSDTPMIVTECDDAKSLKKITGKASLIEWADETVGDTHIGKRKQKTMKKNGKGKKQNIVLASDEETPSPEGSSTTDSDNGGDGEDQYRIEPSSGGTQFTGDKHNLTMLHI
jgi:hypothetical protein